MKNYEKLIIGFMAIVFIFIIGIQVGIYKGREIEKEEGVRENGFLNEIINELKIQITEKNKLLQKKKDTFEATAYCNHPICINVKKYRDGLTSTGTIARVGIVAVDPSVIPLGRDIYIEGLGWFRTEDTGGKIKGKKIDIFLGDIEKAKEFGRKKVIVYY